MNYKTCCESLADSPIHHPCCESVRLIERLIKQHGEKHRRLITEAIRYLDEHEQSWDLEQPISRNRYVFDLFERADIGKPSSEFLTELLIRAKRFGHSGDWPAVFDFVKSVYADAGIELPAGADEPYKET